MNPPTAPANPARSNKALVVALWANAGLLAVIALVLLTRNGGGPSFLPAAYAQNQPPIAGGAGIFVMPGQMQTNVWGAYLLDIDNKTLCAYQFYPGEKKLRLVAARSYQYDTKLKNYNTDLPPQEIKNLVEKEAAGRGGGGNAGGGGGGAVPPPDAPPEKENK